MTLYFSSKAFSLRGEYYIKDENEQNRFIILGNSALFFDLSVYDSKDNRVATIREKKWTLKPRYYIDLDGFETIELTGRISLKQRFEIDSIGWTIEADGALAHEYIISDSKHTIARVHNHTFSLHSRKEIELYDAAEELTVICIVIAIAAQEQRTAAAAAT